MPHSAFEKFAEKHGLTRLKGGFALYRGVLLPKELRPFRSQDLSLARWIEDERNATVLPVVEHGDRTFSERPLPSFSNSVVLDPDYDRFDVVPRELIRRIESRKDRAKILVVTSKAFKSEWCRTLSSHEKLCSRSRILVVDHSEAIRLLKPPPQARVATSRATKKNQTVLNGKVSVNWDIAVIDSPEQNSNSPADVLLLRAVRRSSTASLTVYGKGERSPNDYRVCCENLDLDAEKTEDFVHLVKTRMKVSIGIVRGKPDWPVIPASGRGRAFDRGYAEAVREREQSIVGNWVRERSVQLENALGCREFLLALSPEHRDRTESTWKQFVTDVHSSSDCRTTFNRWRKTVLRASMPALTEFAASTVSWNERCVFVFEDMNEVDHLIASAKRKFSCEFISDQNGLDRLGRGVVGVTTRQVDSGLVHGDTTHRFSFLLPLTFDRVRDWVTFSDKNTSLLSRELRRGLSSGSTIEEVVRRCTAFSLQS